MTEQERACRDVTKWANRVYQAPARAQKLLAMQGYRRAMAELDRLEPAPNSVPIRVDSLR